MNLYRERAKATPAPRHRRCEVERYLSNCRLRNARLTILRGLTKLIIHIFRSVIK